MIVQNNSDQIQLQVPDPATLGIEKAQLQDCEKVSTVTLIGQRSFKVTCYFVNFLRNFNKANDSIFDWQVIYIEAYLSTQDSSLVIALTEKDFKQLISMLKETTANQDTGNMMQIDTAKILHKALTNNELMQLALDVITLGSVDDMKLIVSFNHLQRRVKERNILIANFQETGSRYLRKYAGNMEDPELASFTTSVH